MSGIVYVSHGLLFVYDPSVAEPGCEWSNIHESQGFARRMDCVNFACPLQDAKLSLSISREAFGLADWMARATAVSVFSSSARLRIDSVGDSEENALFVDLGRQGWQRVTFAVGAEADEERVLRGSVFAIPDTEERPSEILKADAWIANAPVPLVEVASVAPY
jgi:hypothetical protein